MSLGYLRFEIFGLALTDMAAGTGSISTRLCAAYGNYLHKLDWEKDFGLIPPDYKNNFLQLRKILSEELFESIEQERSDIQKQHLEYGITLSSDQLSEMTNAKTVIRNMHWRKAQKAAEIMGNIFLGLSHSSNQN
jgi:hypothetical protein